MQMTDFLYKFACFDCRVAFKRQALKEPEGNSAHVSESEIVHYCPNCGHEMAFMGRNFAAPSKSNASAWDAAKALWEAGFRYVGSGSHISPPLPRKKSEVASFISENPRHYQKVAACQSWGELHNKKLQPIANAPVE